MDVAKVTPVKVTVRVPTSLPSVDDMDIGKAIEEVSLEFNKDAAVTCATIKNMLEDFDDDMELPIIKVTAPTMKRVITFCEYHIDHPLPEIEEKDKKRSDNIPEWDLAFLTMKQDDLFELLLAANYLEQTDLLNICCKTVANMIKGKTPEEIRELFNIKDDFTDDEKEQIKKENAWCEESKK